MKKLRITCATDSTKVFLCHVEDDVVPLVTGTECISNLATYLFGNFEPNQYDHVHISKDAMNNIVLDMKPSLHAPLPNELVPTGPASPARKSLKMSPCAPLRNELVPAVPASPARKSLKMSPSAPLRNELVPTGPAYPARKSTFSPVQKKMRVSPATPEKCGIVSGLASSFEKMMSPQKQEVDDDLGCTQLPTILYPLSTSRFKLLATAFISPFICVIDVLDFTKFLNETAVLYCIVGNGTTAIKSLRESAVNPKGFDVEFLNEHVATLFCNIDNLMYEDEQVILAQERVYEGPKTVKSEIVKVSNLPLNFKEIRFKCAMSLFVLEKDLVSDVEAVVRVSNYDRDSGTCLIEFINPTLAAAFCEQEVIHGGAKLTLHQLERTGTVVPLEESRVILVGNLPTFFDQPHFISFMNNTLKSTPGSESGRSCITRICNYIGHTCMVQFTDAKTAQDVLKHHPIIYDRRELTLELSDKLLPDGSTFVSFENLPSPFRERHFWNFLHETAECSLFFEDGEQAVVDVFDYDSVKNRCCVQFVNPATATKMSIIHPFLYGKNVLKVALIPAADTPSATELITPPATEPALTLAEAPVVETHGTAIIPSEIQIDPDVISKAAGVPGQVAIGKLGGSWDQTKGEIFFRVAVAYKDDNGSLPYARIRAHLWLHYKLDFSEEQLKEKMRSSRNYFVHTVMKSESGLEGTSTYPHYDSMLELYPVYQNDKIIQNRKLIKSQKALKKDSWDKAAIRMLLAEYKTNQSMFNAVDGTHRTSDVYKLVSIAMRNGGRNFDAEECKKRMDSLNATFFTIQDCEGNQSGGGNCGLDPEVLSDLQDIHNGSVAIESPYAHSVGSTTQIKRGNFAPVKVLGASKPVKLRRSFDSRTDYALTTSQRRKQLENERAENALALQRQTIDLIASLTKSREERKSL